MLQNETLWDEGFMLKTILLGSCVLVQGVFVRNLANGKITVRVGSRMYTGQPVGGKITA